MAKFPLPPASHVPASIPAIFHHLKAGTSLARIYFTGQPYPTTWNQFRDVGPLDSRFDHHLPDSLGNPQPQAHTVLYCAEHYLTALAESFQQFRRIDRFRRTPWLAIFDLTRDGDLLDLTGVLPTQLGASMALNNGSRQRARLWARVLYAAYPTCVGFYYSSSMHRNQPCIVFNDRAMTLGILPPHPRFNRPLADPVLLPLLNEGARYLNYKLR